MKTEGGTCPILKQVAFIMRLYDNSVPWSCVYIKLSVGTLVLPLEVSPYSTTYNTQSPTPIYTNKIHSPWSVQCIIQLLS